MTDHEHSPPGPASGAQPRKVHPAVKKAARHGPRADKTGGEAAVLAKIAAMSRPFNAMGQRLHSLILRTDLVFQPTVWYGLPGYAKDGNTVYLFRRGQAIHDVRLRPGGEPHP
ncbi:MAG TPA: hypothetical protein VKU19_14825 [Bryobacteraceae bacterium]|nr:hypothetical protein [Bryobacteraceae bacterium]